MQQHRKRRTERLETNTTPGRNIDREMRDAVKAALIEHAGETWGMDAIAAWSDTDAQIPPDPWNMQVFNAMMLARFKELRGHVQQTTPTPAFLSDWREFNAVVIAAMKAWYAENVGDDEAAPTSASDALAMNTGLE